MEELLSDPISRGSTILAHNGGAYDCKFILQYLEHNLIDYDILPRPGSIHKYLCLTIRGKSKTEHIVFKDFMMFVSGSLKSIAEGFKLEISKGDFPPPPEKYSPELRSLVVGMLKVDPDQRFDID